MDVTAALPDLPAALAARGLAGAGSCEGLSAAGDALLHNATLLESFRPAELDTLGASMLRVRAAPGQVLIAEGETGDWMLLLLAGTVDVTRKTPQGVPSRLAVLRPGAAIGEMSMLDGEPRYATCTAIEPIEAGLLTRAAIGQLIRDHPAVGAKLLVKITQLLAQRLRNTSNQLVRHIEPGSRS